MESQNNKNKPNVRRMRKWKNLSHEINENEKKSQKKQEVEEREEEKMISMKIEYDWMECKSFETKCIYGAYIHNRIPYIKRFS